MHLNAISLQTCSLHNLKKHLNSPNSLPLAPASRYAILSYTESFYSNVLITCLFLTFVLAVQQQLQALMETLSTTEPHYIRCVKPNSVLKPGIFENFNVLNQLRCGVCYTSTTSVSIIQVTNSYSIDIDLAGFDRVY